MSPPAVDMLMRRLVLVVPLVLLTACGGPPGRDRDRDGAPDQGAPRLTLITSPNGEPLGRALCTDALMVWLGHADTNRDGQVSKDEFMADSASQFRRMDRDGDGFITPDELQALRLPFMIEQNEAEDQRRRPGRGAQALEIGRDPVMTADTNLDFKVSVTEFRVHSDEEFRRLDADHDGALSPDEMRKSCPAQPAQGQARSDITPPPPR